ncbi:MAG: membrane protein insertion efficiency factor YidD [Candidatus Margulisbacteria bacterium]|nr:membrane protein insertion efficiency factor YidD [Candidatus Margulisiibacteriota bacterium]
MRSFLIGIIWVYQHSISVLFPSKCRFYPTCSTYTAMKIEELGCTRGLLLGVKRILKCHPYSRDDQSQAQVGEIYGTH